MITAIDLLLTAPEDQAVRVKLAYSAIVNEDWAEAAFSLNHAARESSGLWSSNCLELADFCTSNIKQPAR